jgi:hypothetical protein
VSTLLARPEANLEQENEIVSAEPLADFIMLLSFSDGGDCLADFKPHIAKGGVLAQLADPEVFRSVKIVLDGYAVEFPGGIDFCADTLRYDAAVAGQTK